jgi:hypothetical protein
VYRIRIAKGKLRHCSHGAKEPLERPAPEVAVLRDPSRNYWVGDFKQQRP